MLKGVWPTLVFFYFFFSNLYCWYNFRLQAYKLKHTKSIGCDQDYYELGTFRSALDPLNGLTPHLSLGGFHLFPCSGIRSASLFTPVYHAYLPLLLIPQYPPRTHLIVPFP